LGKNRLQLIVRRKNNHKLVCYRRGRIENTV
jgi:hypothetical protein